MFTIELFRTAMQITRIQTVNRTFMYNYFLAVLRNRKYIFDMA